MGGDSTWLQSRAENEVFTRPQGEGGAPSEEGTALVHPRKPMLQMSHEWRSPDPPGLALDAPGCCALEERCCPSELRPTGGGDCDADIAWRK
jgi:hypothetical protein